jgi:hypothetical protein
MVCPKNFNMNLLTNFSAIGLKTAKPSIHPMPYPIAPKPPPHIPFRNSVGGISSYTQSEKTVNRSKSCPPNSILSQA